MEGNRRKDIEWNKTIRTLWHQIRRQFPLTKAETVADALGCSVSHAHRLYDDKEECSYTHYKSAKHLLRAFKAEERVRQLEQQAARDMLIVKSDRALRSGLRQLMLEFDPVYQLTVDALKDYRAKEKESAERTNEADAA